MPIKRSSPKNHQTEIERDYILDFYIRFEELFLYEGGISHVSRTIMFKKWYDDRYELVDAVMEAQDRFEAQVELQKLRAAGQLYLPADYKED